MKKIFKKIGSLIRSPKLTLRVFFSIYVSLISIKMKTNFLGTPYGGWNFVTNKNLENSTIISAGVGEDISFDIEFINLFGGKVLFVDPTPRSLIHMEGVIKNLGNKKTSNYDLTSGKQNIKSYDLLNVNNSNIEVINKALTNEADQKVKFYSPLNEEHVSYSISNWEKDKESKRNFIEVETTTISQIALNYNLTDIPLIKLDIEGAENDVLQDMIKKEIKPYQILVEFDELQNITLKSYVKTLQTVMLLLREDYKLININNFPNFLFVHKRLIK